MALYVQKYGGSSLQTPEHITQVARRVPELRKKNHQIIVVVSAMGKTTDELTRLAYEISSTRFRRE